MLGLICSPPSAVFNRVVDELKTRFLEKEGADPRESSTTNNNIVIERNLFPLQTIAVSFSYAD